MSIQSKIEQALERNRDELTKELLWIRINEGLVHLPWDELDEVGKQRMSKTLEIMITAMEQSYEMGRADMTISKLDDVFGATE